MIEVIVGVGVVFMMLVIMGYNTLIRAKIQVRQSWAQVAAQLQRRYDLIPNLVATVQGYAAHERDVLEQVTTARATALAQTDPGLRPAAEDLLTDAIGRLLAIAENYPQLQADGRFQHFQRELQDTEDRIAFARDFANSRVANYRKLTDSFPSNLIARFFDFPREEMFALDDARAAIVPTISFEGR